MTTIPTKRFVFGWLFGIVFTIWLFILIRYLCGYDDEGVAPPVLIGFGIACVALAIPFFVRHTALIVGDGHLTIPSWFGNVRIPVAVIQSASVVRIQGGTYLEVCLHEVPDSLRPYQNTWTKRKMQHMRGYNPPPEPYLFLSVAQPDCSDSTLMDLIEIERETRSQASLESPR